MSGEQKKTWQLKPGERVVNDRFRPEPVLSVVQLVESRRPDFPGSSTVFFLNEHLAVVVGDNELWEIAPAETDAERVDRIVRGATEPLGSVEDGDVKVLGAEVLRLRAELATAHDAINAWHRVGGTW